MSLLEDLFSVFDQSQELEKSADLYASEKLKRLLGVQSPVTYTEAILKDMAAVAPLAPAIVNPALGAASVVANAAAGSPLEELVAGYYDRPNFVPRDSGTKDALQLGGEMVAASLPVMGIPAQMYLAGKLGKTAMDKILSDGMGTFTDPVKMTPLQTATQLVLAKNMAKGAMQDAAPSVLNFIKNRGVKKIGAELPPDPIAPEPVEPGKVINMSRDSYLFRNPRRGGTQLTETVDEMFNNLPEWKHKLMIKTSPWSTNLSPSENQFPKYSERLQATKDAGLTEATNNLRVFQSKIISADEADRAIQSATIKSRQDAIPGIGKRWQETVITPDEIAKKRYEFTPVDPKSNPSNLLSKKPEGWLPGKHDIPHPDVKGTGKDVTTSSTDLGINDWVKGGNRKKHSILVLDTNPDGTVDISSGKIVGYEEAAKLLDMPGFDKEMTIGTMGITKIPEDPTYNGRMAIQLSDIYSTWILGKPFETYGHTYDPKNYTFNGLVETVIAHEVNHAQAGTVNESITEAAARKNVEMGGIFGDNKKAPGKMTTPTKMHDLMMKDWEGNDLKQIRQDFVDFIGSSVEGVNQVLADNMMETLGLIHFIKGASPELTSSINKSIAKMLSDITTAKSGVDIYANVDYFKYALDKFEKQAKDDADAAMVFGVIKKPHKPAKSQSSLPNPSDPNDSGNVPSLPPKMGLTWDMIKGINSVTQNLLKAAAKSIMPLHESVVTLLEQNLSALKKEGAVSGIDSSRWEKMIDDFKIRSGESIKIGQQINTTLDSIGYHNKRAKLPDDSIVITNLVDMLEEYNKHRQQQDNLLNISPLSEIASMMNITKEEVEYLEAVRDVMLFDESIKKSMDEKFKGMANYAPHWIRGDWSSPDEIESIPGQKRNNIRGALRHALGIIDESLLANQTSDSLSVFGLYDVNTKKFNDPVVQKWLDNLLAIQKMIREDPKNYLRNPDADTPEAAKTREEFEDSLNALLAASIDSKLGHESLLRTKVLSGQEPFRTKSNVPTQGTMQARRILGYGRAIENNADNIMRRVIQQMHKFGSLFPATKWLASAAGIPITDAQGNMVAPDVSINETAAKILGDDYQSFVNMTEKFIQNAYYGGLDSHAGIPTSFSRAVDKIWGVRTSYDPLPNQSAGSHIMGFIYKNLLARPLFFVLNSTDPFIKSAMKAKGLSDATRRFHRTVSNYAKIMASSLKEWITGKETTEADNPEYAFIKRFAPSAWNALVDFEGVAKYDAKKDAGIMAEIARGIGKAGTFTYDVSGAAWSWLVKRIEVQERMNNRIITMTAVEELIENEVGQDAADAAVKKHGSLIRALMADEFKSKISKQRARDMVAEAAIETINMQGIRATALGKSALTHASTAMLGKNSVASFIYNMSGMFMNYPQTIATSLLKNTAKIADAAETEMKNGNVNAAQALYSILSPSMSLMMTAAMLYSLPDLLKEGKIAPGNMLSGALRDIGISNPLFTWSMMNDLKGMAQGEKKAKTSFMKKWIRGYSTYKDIENMMGWNKPKSTLTLGNKRNIFKSGSRKKTGGVKW